jgi:hypothetical protein
MEMAHASIKPRSTGNCRPTQLLLYRIPMWYLRCQMQAKNKRFFRNSRVAILLSVSPFVLLGGCAKSAHTNFTGLWQVADPELVKRPDVYATEADYMPEAWANLQDFRKNWEPGSDDPASVCVRYGMPHVMTPRARTYLMDIYQTAARITVLMEYMDNHRLIHFDRGPVPAAATPSNNGYSIGRWDGDSLVIETTLLKARSPVGPIQRSDQARFTERWTLRNDATLGKTINIDITTNDPVTFRHPVESHQVLKAADAGTTLNEYACADALWEDHVTSRRAGTDAAAR